MDGKKVARIVDAEREKRGLSQKDFCKMVGVGSSAYSAWRKGTMPKPEMLIKIEKLFDISFADYEKEDTDENWELLQLMRERPEMRNLLHSARNLPTSSIYLLIAQVEKEKESGTSY